MGGESLEDDQVGVFPRLKRVKAGLRHLQVAPHGTGELAAFSHHSRATEGAWEEWVAFFAEGVRETAMGAVSTAQRLVELVRQDRTRIQDAGRVASSALRVHQALRERPVASAAGIVARTGLSTPAVNNALAALGRTGVAHELTGRRRGGVFASSAYLLILGEGTEPL